MPGDGPTIRLEERFDLMVDADAPVFGRLPRPQ